MVVLDTNLQAERINGLQAAVHHAANRTQGDLRPAGGQRFDGLVKESHPIILKTPKTVPNMCKYV